MTLVVRRLGHLSIGSAGTFHEARHALRLVQRQLLAELLLLSAQVIRLVALLTELEHTRLRAWLCVTVLLGTCALVMLLEACACDGGPVPFGVPERRLSHLHMLTGSDGDGRVRTHVCNGLRAVRLIAGMGTLLLLVDLL